MSTYEIDPIVKLATADGLIERTNISLDQIIRELILALDPFPGFLGLETLHAVEIESLGQTENLGCVVVCPDGAIYELVLRMVPGHLDEGNLDHDEELKPLNLTPSAMVAVNYAAIEELSRLLRERQ